MQALATGLEQHRKRRILRRDREQVGSTLALLPQRCALVGSATRQQQSTRRALAEARRKKRRLRHGGNEHLGDLVGVDEQLLDWHAVDGLGQAQHDAVVAVHRLDGDAEALHQTVLECDRPRRVHRRAERRMDADTPVADLVTEPFDHDGAVVGQRARGLHLLRHVRKQVARRERVEAVLRLQRRFGGRRRLHLLFADGAQELPDCAAQLERPPETIAVPIRHLARLARSRVHDHAVKRHVFDAPRRRTENECLPRPRFVDHFFVEFANPRAVGKEHAKEPAVGNRATVGDRESLCTVAGAQRVGDAIPHDARLQVAELFARVATGQEVEHVVAHLVGKFGEVRTASHHRGERGDARVGMHRHVRHDVLGEHVERVAQIARRLDVSIEHAPRDDGDFEQVMSVLGEHLAAARRPHCVSGAADALQSAAHCTGRLHLNDEVDGAHVDAEFEAARGDDGAQLPALQLVFDHDALLARERPVVRLHEVASGIAAGEPEVGGKFVELRGQPLSTAPGVAEDDGAAMLLHQFEDARGDARPDARAPLDCGRRRRTTAQLVGDLADLAHVFDRHHHFDLECLARTRVDDRDRSRRAVDVPAEKPRDFFKRALRSRQTDALRRPQREFFQPFERQSEVRAALGGGDGVDFVDDHRVDVGERRARRRREHEIQTLRRRDENVGRIAQHALPVARARVAGAHRDERLAEVSPNALGGVTNSDDRSAKVLLHVECKRPQRRYVEHASRRRFVGVARDEPVDGHEERRERLAAARRRRNERVLAGEDLVEAVRLCRGGCGKRRREPRANGL